MCKDGLNQHSERPHARSALGQLSQHYALVLVCSQSSGLAKRFQDYASAVYVVSTSRFGCKGLLDCSAVYSDFGVHFPSSDVLVLASHDFTVSGLQHANWPLNYRRGLYSELLISRVPLSLRESSPITLVVPRHSANGPNLLAIAEQLIACESFSNLLLSSNIRAVSTTLPTETLIEKTMRPQTMTNWVSVNEESQDLPLSYIGFVKTN